MKIVIFGTGSSCEYFINSIDKDKVKVLCLTDNNVSKHYDKFMGYQIVPPTELKNVIFDYIYIASQYSIDIMKQLLDMGIPYDQIIPTDYEKHNYHAKNSHESNIKRILKIQNKAKSKDGKLVIAVVNYNNSSSNGYSLFRNIPPYISAKYNVEYVTENNATKLTDCDVICSSNHEGIYDGIHINIEMWHGFPIKRMGFMHEEYATKKFMSYQTNRGNNIQLIMSYSSLYTTFFNACFPNDSNKYRVTGMPRNDLLFETGSLEKLARVCQRELKDKRVVFYLPTWRKGKNERVDSSKEWNGLFGFADESMDTIIEMVEKNNIFLVVKLHPFEYNEYKDIELFNNENIFLLSEEMLITHKVHLYEVLASAGLLITDYSSIYFDTLLVDIPIIFAPTDQEDYSEHRGFLAEPYQYFTPGPNVYSFAHLHEELVHILNGQDRFKVDRERLKKLIFKYDDNKSSLRVWKEIDEYLTRYIESAG